MRACRNEPKGCTMPGVTRREGHPADGLCNWCLLDHPIPRKVD